MTPTTETVDAQSYALNLKLLTELLPAMHEPARKRAAWRMARGKANLADAVAAEGYRLDGATAPPTAPAVRTAPTPPSAAASIAELRHAQAVLQNAGAPPHAVAVVRNLAAEKIHEAARAAMQRNQKLTYEQAVTAVTR